MREHIVKIVCAAGIMGTLFAAPAMAAEWKQESDGRWWYQNDDGTYPVSSWKTIGDKEYYFDAKGYMVVNTTIGDKTVGEDGAVIETSAEAVSEESEADETATEDTASAEAAAEEDEFEIGSDEDLALKTLKALYNSSDKASLVVYSIKCETFNYVSGNREAHHDRVCLINYEKSFSDPGSRIVGFYNSNVFGTTTTPVAKYTARTLREATDIVEMDVNALLKKVKNQ